MYHIGIYADTLDELLGLISWLGDDLKMELREMINCEYNEVIFEISALRGRLAPDAIQTWMAEHADDSMICNIWDDETEFDPKGNAIGLHYEVDRYEINDLGTVPLSHLGL